jgi:hypothetical protein
VYSYLKNNAHGANIDTILSELEIYAKLSDCRLFSGVLHIIMEF